MKHTMVIATLLLGVGCSGSGIATGGDDDEVDDGKADGVATKLQPVQIKDLGSLSLFVNHTISYSGNPRYIGAKVHVAKGEEIDLANTINSEVFPVVVIADSTLTELVSVTGETITGSPNFASAFATLVAPADGEYWMLFGEASRKPFKLVASVTLEDRSGATCSNGDSCVSFRCVAGHCDVSHPTEGCLANSDCTSGKCETAEHVCQFISSGDACNPGDNSDCEQGLCNNGVCGCWPDGTHVTSGDAPCCGAVDATDTGGFICVGP